MIILLLKHLMPSKGFIVLKIKERVQFIFSVILKEATYISSPNAVIPVVYWHN